VDYFRGVSTPQTDKLDLMVSTHRLAVGDLIVAEVLRGFRDDDSFERARKLLDRFLLIEVGGYRIAVQAAKNFRMLKALGITIRNTVDTFIATKCIEDGLSLLHSDRDFDPFVAHLGLKSVL
jgi:predicted nucleic acid-binding protein